MVFTVNGEVWQVKQVPANHYMLRRPRSGVFALGVCDDLTRTIYISDKVQGRYLRKVLAHEVTHAAMFAYDVYLTEDQEELLASIIDTFGQEIIHITNTLFSKIKGGRF